MTGIEAGILQIDMGTFPAYACVLNLLAAFIFYHFYIFLSTRTVHVRVQTRSPCGLLPTNNIPTSKSLPHPAGAPYDRWSPIPLISGDWGKIWEPTFLQSPFKSLQSFLWFLCAWVLRQQFQTVSIAMTVWRSLQNRQMPPGALQDHCWAPARWQLQGRNKYNRSRLHPEVEAAGLLNCGCLQFSWKMGYQDMQDSNIAFRLGLLGILQIH